MNTLVTGGDGFAGSYLVEYLLEQGQEVIASVRQPEKNRNWSLVSNQLRIERADLLDRPGLIRLLDASKPERIYHLAGVSSSSESMRDPVNAYQVNFEGTLNLLSAWRQLEFESRFLYVSSAEVYGVPRTEDVPLREGVALHPITPYAASKAAAEMLALQFAESYAMPIVRVRPFNHTGPRQSSKYVCSSFARQIAEIDVGLRPAIVAVGNIKVSRDFCDVRDIVRGYQLLLDKGKQGDVYHLCSGHAVSVEWILQKLIAMSSKSIEIVIDRSRIRNQDAPVFWGDASKARDVTGWETHYELEATLRDLKCYWDNVVRSSVGSGPSEEAPEPGRKN